MAAFIGPLLCTVIFLFGLSDPLNESDINFGLQSHGTRPYDGKILLQRVPSVKLHESPTCVAIKSSMRRCCMFKINFKGFKRGDTNFNPNKSIDQRYPQGRR